jgi:hypothetical protein
MNNGICSLTNTSYKCLCQSSFTGLNCEQSYNPCSNSPCLNNALCTVNLSIFPYYECTCSPGFSGTKCQIKLNSKILTVNSSCVDSDIILCRYYSSQKYCNGPYYIKGIQVLNYCPRSCNVCTPSPSQCLDQDTQCNFWASKNYCKNYPIFNICKKSCNLC